ncbi:MAG: DUF3488 and transglutaminase-like domain-containing protein [Mariprofundales bacterium]
MNHQQALKQAEHLTLGVLMCGVVALALSDFVSPIYWSVAMVCAALRFWLGTIFHLKELHASLLAWLGCLWVVIELIMGRDFLVAFTDFLLILSLAVIIEEGTARNHLHRLLTGLFLILAAAVLTDSVLYAIPLGLFLMLMWRASARLYGMQLPGGDLRLESWHYDARLFAVMLSATVILFLLVPRIGYGNLLQNVQRQMATSGFSDEVTFGDFARSLDPTVIMRVEVPNLSKANARKLLEGRYWRGVALSDPMAKGWRRGGERVVKTWTKHQDIKLKPSVMRTKNTHEIVTYREAMDHRYLFIPDGISSVKYIPMPITNNTHGSLQLNKKTSRRLYIKMDLEKSAKQRLHWFIMPPPTAWDYKTINSSIITTWAKQNTNKISDPMRKMQALANTMHLWNYDLNAKIDVNNPIEYFINNTQSGHCELFASALALAGRSLGIATRVVNGYYGGEWNDVGGFLLLRQSHAHAWVEVWDGKAWQHIDPTPASRWHLSSDILFSEIDNVWESIKLMWYRYVLEFQNNDRNTLLVLIKTWLSMYWFWFIIPITLVLSWIYIFQPWYKNRQKKAAQYGHKHNHWRLMDRWLKRRGMQRKLSQSLCEMQSPKGVDIEAWLAFVQDWESQAYGVQAAWNTRQLRRHLRGISSAHW